MENRENKSQLSSADHSLSMQRKTFIFINLCALAHKEKCWVSVCTTVIPTTVMAAESRCSHIDRGLGGILACAFGHLRMFVQSMMKGEIRMVITREESHLKRGLPGERRGLHNITNKGRNATKERKLEEIRFRRTKSKPQ